MADYLAQIITQMALIGDDKAKETLRAASLQCSLWEWKRNFLIKVTSIGVLTGAPGGLGSLVLEVGDLAYLFSACGRACYGIGYIMKREVDFDNDMAKILAIWAGVAKATNRIATGKIALTVGGPAAMGPAIVQSVFATQAVTSKFFGKAAGKAVAKFMAKWALSMTTNWVPVIGGAVSGGVNFWIASTLMDAAETYYSCKYVELSDNFARELAA
jgi:hypothetical protein